MATQKPKATPDTTAAVDAFMADLDHPHKSAIEILRAIIRAADPSIHEGVKWNAPSFRTTEYFATVHLKGKTGVAVILHLGAKARADAKVDIEDPGKELKWLGKDRAIIEFTDEKDAKSRKAAFTKILRQWIKHV
jgi:hypothetical protein